MGLRGFNEKNDSVRRGNRAPASCVELGRRSALAVKAWDRLAEMAGGDLVQFVAL
jgi:hypothetical protein